MTGIILSILGFFIKLFVKGKADQDAAMKRAQAFLYDRRLFAKNSKKINDEYNEQKEGFEKRDESLDDQ